MIASRQKDYIWNSVAGIINAAEAVIMSMVVTRLGQLSDAGILSLAFAAGNVLMVIGKFGGRMYQVTDVKGQYSFRMYLTQRFLTLGIMALSLAGLLLYGHYSEEKKNAIILIALIYMVESIEDCVWGQYQMVDRLYVGAQRFSTRWIAILIAFIATMAVTHNMITALLVGGTAGAIVFIIWMIYLWDNGTLKWRRQTRDFNVPIFGAWIQSLFRQTLPLFFASFCAILLSNIPKFVIDRHLSDEVQACYSFVAMPVFVIGLLNQFIYQPTVVKLTNDYYDGQMEQFRHEVKRQMLFVAGIALMCVFGAGIVGVPALSVLYHTDLSKYWRELVVLQFAGGFLALTGYFTVLLTLMRRQNIIIIGYMGILIIGIPIINGAVEMAGTIGASIGYLLLMVTLFAFYFVFCLSIISSSQRERNRV